jgi:DNA-binding transcriptional LysR family regulator
VLENVMEIGSREGIREAVAAGLGIGVVPWSERGNDNRLHYISVRDADLKNTEYVCCQRARRTRAPIQAFIDLVPPLGIT